MVTLNDIQRFFNGTLRIAEPMGKYTSFHIGGPADYYLEPASKTELVRLVNYFRQNTFPFIMIGNASNLLVSDQGYRGAVVNLECALPSIRMEGDMVYAEAGVRTGRFVDFCIQRSLQGAETLAGLPGTLGGRVMTAEGSLSEHIVEVEILRDNSVARLTNEEGGVVYRKSGSARDIVLAARFRFPEGDKEELMRLRRELLIQRNDEQPLNHPNAGSIFKNPPGNSAARLIHEAGLKGCVHGRAMVSDRHANFILNNGGAGAREVVELIKVVQQTVRAKFNVALELDVKLIGFEEQVLKEVA